MISRRLGLSAFLMLAVLAVGSGPVALAEENPVAEPVDQEGVVVGACATAMQPFQIGDTPPEPTFMTCGENGTGCTTSSCLTDEYCATICCAGAEPRCGYGCPPNPNFRKCICII